MHGFITRSVRLLAVPLLLAGVVAGISPVAAAARAGSPGPAAAFTISGALSGVAATSATNAWAVGSTGSGKALIVRWNGAAWTQVASPAPASSNLSGVAATSATNAWAVGSTSSGTLILRWNGTAWTQVPSPSPGTAAGLYGVAATSAGVAWAVGYTATSTGTKTLILQWTGAAWKRVPSPSPAGNGADLSGVAATSTSRVWATGCSGCAFGGFAQSLIVRWNGTAWKQVPSPSPAGGGDLFGVAAVSASSAWAVGGYYAVSGSSFSVKTLTAGWNGTAWKQVPSPSPGTQASLRSVAAVSASSAWAVGATDTSAGSNTLILRWNGKTWKVS